MVQVWISKVHSSVLGSLKMAVMICSMGVMPGTRGGGDNTSKAEHLVCFQGPRSNIETQKAEQRNQDPCKGKTCDQAKYLGNISHHTGKNETEY